MNGQVTDNYGMHFTSSARPQRKTWLQVPNIPTCFFFQICFEDVGCNAASEVHVHKVFFQTHYSFTCSCIACQLDLPRTENLPDQVDSTLTKEIQG